MKKIILILSLLIIMLIGCVDEKRDNIEVNFNYKLAAKFEKSIRRSIKRSSQSIKGEMTITDLITTNTIVKDWYVVLDEDNFNLTSKTTVILKPSDYEFTLVVTQGNHRYTGTTTGVTINDGTNDVVLTLKPVIGEVNTNTNLTQTSNLKLKYETAELSNITDPKVGVIVDGGNEDIYTINKTTGLSNYIVLTEGSYHIDLKFYDGSKQIGKSVDAQENIDVNIVDIAMDIVPLHGETTISLDLAGNEATFNFTIPSEIIDEVDGLANLEATLTLSSVVNGNQSDILPFSFDGTNYVASHTYGNFKYDNVSIQLQFVDTTNSEEVASGILAGVELSENANNQTIDISLIRRSLIQGNIKAVLGVRVYDLLNNPVLGAKVFSGNELLGLTDSKGFLKVYLPKGNYTIRAENADGSLESEKTLNLNELEIENLDLTVVEVVLTLHTLRGFNSVNEVVEFNNELYFVADDGVIGNEVWKSNGTTVTLLKDIYPGTTGSYPKYFKVYNNELYFQARDSVKGVELWKTDGTVSGTLIVKDINSDGGNSDPEYLTVMNGMLYFGAYNGHTSGFELWKSDGTDLGTSLVKDIIPGDNHTGPRDLYSVNGILYFTFDDGITGNELWKSDGTEAGTVLVKDIYIGSASGNPGYLTEFDGELYFVCRTGNTDVELWKSNGTEAGTVLVKDINPGSEGGHPALLTVVNETLFFRAFDSIHGYELWKSDGTESGTLLVKDIYTGTNGGGLQFLTVMNNEIYFRGKTSSKGYEIWKSDGTENGTIMLKDINGGSGDSHIGHLTVVRNKVYFSAYSPAYGRELWMTDGTVEGTEIAEDIRSGGGQSNPEHLINVNNNLYFFAKDDSNILRLRVLK